MLWKCARFRTIGISLSKQCNNRNKVKHALQALKLFITDNRKAIKHLHSFQSMYEIHIYTFQNTALCPFIIKPFSFHVLCELAQHFSYEHTYHSNSGKLNSSSARDWAVLDPLSQHEAIKETVFSSKWSSPLPPSSCENMGAWIFTISWVSGAQ